MSSIEIPDPLPLRTITPPPEVYRVAGCDCGGVQWHRAPDRGDGGCSIWGLNHEEAMAAVNDAEARGAAFTAALNMRLRAALGNQEAS